MANDNADLDMLACVAAHALYVTLDQLEVSDGALVEAIETINLDRAIVSDATPRGWMPKQQRLIDLLTSLGEKTADRLKR